MKKLLIASLILIGTSNSFGQSYSDSTINRIQNFLIEFKIAIDSKKKGSVKKFIYPTKSKRGNIVRQTIKHIFENNEKKFGNFSYSDRAFDLIKDSLYIDFKPVPFRILNILRREEDQRMVVDQFEQNNIAIFDVNSAHVILLLEEDQIRLFFWENMNKLLFK